MQSDDIIRLRGELLELRKKAVALSRQAKPHRDQLRKLEPLLSDVHTEICRTELKLAKAEERVEVVQFSLGKRDLDKIALVGRLLEGLGKEDVERLRKELEGGKG